MSKRKEETELKTYTVKAGDTLWAIARRFDTIVSLLKKANKKHSDTIYPGEVLVIPGSEPEVVPVTAPPVKPKPPKPEFVHGSPVLPSQEGGFKMPRGRYTLQQLDDIRLLARLVYSEAGGEPYEGQVAVAAVALNRLRHGDFPDTLHDIVYQPLQFEPVDVGTIDKTPTNSAYRAALDALSGIDPTKGAIYFWNPDKVKEENWVWTREITMRIGRHVFAI